MFWKSPKMEKDAHNAVPEYIYNLLVKGFLVSNIPLEI